MDTSTKWQVECGVYCENFVMIRLTADAGDTFKKRASIPLGPCTYFPDHWLIAFSAPLFFATVLQGAWCTPAGRTATISWATSRRRPACWRPPPWVGVARAAWSCPRRWAWRPGATTPSSGPRRPSTPGVSMRVSWVTSRLVQALSSVYFISMFQIVTGTYFERRFLTLKGDTTRFLTDMTHVRNNVW